MKIAGKMMDRAEAKVRATMRPMSDGEVRVVDAAIALEHRIWDHIKARATEIAMGISS